MLLQLYFIVAWLYHLIILLQLYFIVAWLYHLKMLFQSYYIFACLYIVKLVLQSYFMALKKGISDKLLNCKCLKYACHVNYVAKQNRDCTDSRLPANYYLAEKCTC